MSDITLSKQNHLYQEDVHTQVKQIATMVLVTDVLMFEPMMIENGRLNIQLYTDRHDQTKDETDDDARRGGRSPE
ncbi:unnamed protein product [Pleuronectes platessa]|uniref:Uncharacterized protein n=1 Tax=Pleuronectes platessa TaxID=8262 RepID=A0A9N7TLD5_PLEPL|nr:unnamed protein product [Pleuronectes platessa]